MTEPFRYRVEVTRELLDRAEPELAALLWWANERTYARRMARRPRQLTAVRWLGFAVALLGVLVAGASIALTPDAPCAAASLRRDHAMIVFCVLAATLFAFLPRIVPALRAWTRDQLGKVAARSLAPARQHAPYDAECAVSPARLEAAVAWAKRPLVTELSRIRSAAVGRGVACLFARAGHAGLRRVVFLPDATTRAGVLDALRGAVREVVEVDAPADGAAPAP